MNNPCWLLERVERYEIVAYSECLKKKPTHICLPRRLVDLAYSQGGVDCLIHADDCCLMLSKWKRHVSSVVMILLTKTYTSRAFASKKYHLKWNTLDFIILIQQSRDILCPCLYDQSKLYEKSECLTRKL